ncbi:MAG: hypothetical protein J3Q66DRAFT_405582 [Benniella sp.]|nr:MAG: hypothetical protein J3Q66DRAFT_405582 [Benniella sp.]
MEATIGVEATIESGGPTSKASPLKRSMFGVAIYVFLRYLEDVAILLSDLAYNNINCSRSSATEEQVKIATDLRQHREYPARLGVEPGKHGLKIVWRRRAVCGDPTYHLDEILQCPLDGPASDDP